MLVLGIETSCDETAVAIVDDKKNILSNQIYSQIKEHEKFGGVMPEIAARSHIEILPSLFKESLKQANIDAIDLDGIAATGGPGLIGGLMIGVMFAKTISSVIQKPFIAINHLEGHALTARLTENLEFPYLLLLVSGGHCQFLLARGIGDYVQLSTTIDDAIGEAFDKVARMLGLGYPGGPIVERFAVSGDPYAFKFPMPLCELNRYDLSFSGLKTAVRLAIEKYERITDETRANICASFQHTIGEIITYKISQIVKMSAKKGYDIGDKIVVAGGVAANSYLRARIANSAGNIGYKAIFPPLNLCTDNAAMIAWAGVERLNLGLISDLGFAPLSRWPLDNLSS